MEKWFRRILILASLILLSKSVFDLFAQQIPPPPHSPVLIWVVGSTMAILYAGIIGLIFTASRVGSRQYAIFLTIMLGIYALYVIFLFANLYQKWGLMDGETLVTRPTDFLYFSIITWTTLGYGDIKPTPDSRLLAASEALCGYIFMGLYLALLFRIVTPGSEDENANT